MKRKILTILVVVLLLTISCNSQTPQQLAPEAFNEKIEKTPEAVLLDVRTPQEFSAGIIKGAVNLDYNSNTFKEEVKKLDKSKTYLVYCLSGMRSASAASYMRSIGFENVINMEGGILLWQKYNLPITKSATQKVEISMDTYKQMTTSDTLVLVDFYAPWCGPCIKMKPMLEEVAEEYKGKLKVLRINIDENKELAKQLDVSAIPVLHIYDKGKKIWTYQGYIEKAALVKQL